MGGTEARPIGFWALLSLGVNGIVGVGIFFAPTEVARSVPGEAGALVYPITALGLLPVAIVYALLGSRFSLDGGPYVWARAAFGPLFSFFIGWMTYASALFSAAAIVSGFARHAAPELGLASGAAVQALAALTAALLGAVAAGGLKPSAVTWSAVTVLKLVPLLLLVGLAIGWQSLPAGGAPEPSLGGLDRAALIVVFALQGFEVVPAMAGSARRSGVAVPICTIGSLVLVAVLYTLIHATCAGAVPSLGNSATPLVDAARALGGPGFERVVALGANVSALGIAFGSFILTPRYLAALGTPEALGAWLGAEDVRRVPQRALWLTVAAVGALVALGQLGQLLVLSSVAVLAQYLVCTAALGRLAWRRQARLSRRHLWPLPFVIVAVALVGRGARLSEIGVALGVLLLGGVIVLGRRARQSLATR